MSKKHSTTSKIPGGHLVQAGQIITSNGFQNSWSPNFPCISVQGVNNNVVLFLGYTLNFDSVDILLKPVLFIIEQSQKLNGDGLELYLQYVNNYKIVVSEIFDIQIKNIFHKLNRKARIKKILK
jgi:hypothetical protein